MGKNINIDNIANTELNHFQKEITKIIDSAFDKMKDTLYPSVKNSRGSQTSLDLSYYKSVNGGIEPGGKNAARRSVNEHYKQDLERLKKNYSNTLDSPEYIQAVNALDQQKKEALTIIENLQEATKSEYAVSATRHKMRQTLEQFKKERTEELVAKAKQVFNNGSKARTQFENSIYEEFKDGIDFAKIAATIKKEAKQPAKLSVKHNTTGSKSLDKIVDIAYQSIVQEIEDSQIILGDGVSDGINLNNVRSYGKIIDDNIKKVAKSLASEGKNGIQDLQKVKKSIVDSLEKKYNYSPVIENFKKLNKDAAALTDPSLSYGASLQNFIKVCEANHIGVKISGDTLGLYPLDNYKGKSSNEVSWDDVAKVQLASLSSDGSSLIKGKTSLPNITYLTDQYNKDTKSYELKAVSAYEQQIINLTKSFGTSGNSKVAKAIRTGNLEGASSIMNLSVNNTLSGIPSGLNKSYEEELYKDMWGGKNPEQFAALTGLINTNSLAQDFFHRNKDKIDEFYKSRNKKKTIDEFHLSPEERQSFTTALVMSAWNEEGRAEELEDSLLKYLLTSNNFEGFRNSAKTLNSAGLMPSLESIKEESFLSGMFSVSGAHDVLPFNTTIKFIEVA